jgi:hypothetical protein
MAAKKTNKPKPPPRPPTTDLVVVENATRWVREPSKPPHLEVLPAGLDVIRDMTRNGHNRDGIARALGMSGPTLGDCIKRQPELAEALSQGRAALHHTIFSALLQQGLDGYAPALMFLAKTQLGWRETDAPESRPNIQIVKLPDCMTPAQYVRSLLTEGEEVKPQ